MSECYSAVTTTVKFWLALHEYVFSKKGYSEGSYFKEDTHARVQVYSLALIFSLWSKPHYRCESFQQDMIDNLKNVAVPGTGIPLSVFCYSWWVCLFFIMFVNPFICFLGAFNKARKDSAGGFISTVCRHYQDHLLRPMDWFSFWRLNCRLASLHSVQLKPRGYIMEDKWTFLKEGDAIGVPVSPFMDAPENIVIKNKNIEGGMGIYFYKNAVHGGDWIIQGKLSNAKWLDKLLPRPAPLSTMRVITSSSWTMKKHGHKIDTAEFMQFNADRSKVTSEEEGTPAPAVGALHKKRTKEPDTIATANKYVKALSAVLRLGRAGASTDHSSVLFDVDTNTGKVKGGTSNAQWYKLGIHNIASCPWLPDGDGFTGHPDTPTNPPVTGQTLPDFQKAMDVVVKSHYDMLPDVPMVGWDVAFCSDGIYLLEVNLSCNFFRGTFDVPSYICFVDEHFRDLEQRDK